ncbi:tafazzin isoform X2 [Helicoverpa zea]|uniref:tafazzin isoform X2 n=1 Tax=Helicoverpa zea TaxID=7113 RepID=UPI001F5A0731|nr:tafazzin isoform X2 [Helicoverpa zea]
MGYDIGWIIPRLRNPGRLWYCASSITVAVVGLFSKIIIGVLDVRSLTSRSRMRWSLAAHDICFTNALHSCFFALGKCVPVVRGAGVHQPAMDFCVERLARGEWVHIFPEGRVNVNKEHIRFKWGVGRLVAECPAPPLIVPVWHEGLDAVLPNQEPYLLKFRKHVFLNVGEPIQIHQLLDKLRRANASEEETRAAITDTIQRELLRLRDATHALIRRAAPKRAADLLAPPPPRQDPEPEL